MNVDTNELIRINSCGFNTSFINQNLVEVPEELQDEANKVLGEKESVVVTKKMSLSLIKWAKKVRKNQMKNKK